MRWRVCLIARCCPRDLGLAFGTWSLAKLADYLASAGVAQISREAIRQILHDGGVRWLATKTWKASTDPQFITKMRRVLDLYDHPPAGGRVVCADEFGPLNLQPLPGRAWRPAAHPARLRATYRRTRGVRHMIAAPDLGSGQITYRIRERKRWREFLAFLKLLRARWPGQKLYVICDNFSPHKHPQVTGWAAGNNVELVFLPTYSSWLNWIEPEFAALRYFVLGGTDHRTHAWQGKMIDRYMRWRNTYARPRPASPQLSHPHLDQLPDQRCMTGLAIAESLLVDATRELPGVPADLAAVLAHCIRSPLPLGLRVLHRLAGGPAASVQVCAGPPG